MSNLSNHNHAVAPSFDRNLFIDRDHKKDFRAFLEQHSKLTFPIIGPGGSGKSWQLQACLNSLPIRYTPAVVSARLATDLILRVRDAFLQVNPGIRPSGGDLSEVLHEISTFTSRKDGANILFLDGLNEFHFHDANFSSLKLQFINLLHILSAFRIKLAFTCRTFTWQEFLIDQSYDSFLFQTGEVMKTYITETYDLRKEDFVKEEHLRAEPLYGLSLNDFSDSEKRKYWDKVGIASKLLHDAPTSYHEISNPFFLSILANHLLKNEGKPPPIQQLFRTYVTGQLAKFTARQSRSSQRRLVAIAEKFIPSPEKTVNPSLFYPASDDPLTDTSLTTLLDSGLLKAAKTENQETFLYFSHDVMMHYYVARALTERHELKNKSIPDQILAIVKLAIKASTDDHNDYFRQAVRFMLNSFIGDFGYCTQDDQVLVKAFNLLLSSLKTKCIGDSFLEEVSQDLLQTKSFGDALSMALRNQDIEEALGRILPRVDIRSSGTHYLNNLAYLARFTDPQIAYVFLAKMTEYKLSEISKLRIINSLGELRIRKAGSLIEGMIDFNANHFGTLNNACLYALGEIGYELRESQLNTLETQTGSAWSLKSYRTRLSEAYPKGKPSA